MIAPLPRTAAIVLDPAFASRLASLADRAAVWIVDSPENRPAIESLWTARRTRAASYDVSVFRMIPGLTPEQHVDGVLRSVGGDAQPDEPLGPVGSIELYGVELTDAMRATLAAHDYLHLEPLGDAFRARRAASDRPR